jgi:hypothetical protein
MKLYLTESELGPLLDKGYRSLPSEQCETHPRPQEQAKSIICVAIARVGAVIV